MNYLNKKDLKICTLNINSTIKDVITNLNKSSMQIAIINSQGGNLLGVITDGDIRRGLLRGLDLSSKISSLIKKNPMVIKKNTPSKTVEYLMKTKILLHLPVVDKNYVTIGLYSWNDHKPNEKIANPVIIMAGGFGKRLLPYTKKTPKNISLKHHWPYGLVPSGPPPSRSVCYCTSYRGITFYTRKILTYWRGHLHPRS